MDREQFFRCEFCGERIGVYERVMVDGRETELAHKPKLWETRPALALIVR